MLSILTETRRHSQLTAGRTSEKKMLAAGTIMGVVLGLMIGLFIAVRPELFR